MDEAEEKGLYVISVAAELVGLHPQTLRHYEREGLVVPTRTRGGIRLYGRRDLARLRRIAQLTAEGVNLAGARRVLELEERNQALRGALAVAGPAAGNGHERRANEG